MEKGSDYNPVIANFSVQLEIRKTSKSIKISTLIVEKIQLHMRKKQRQDYATVIYR